MKNDKSPTQWRCILCGYIHTGTTPPQICTVCGTGPHDFEPYIVQPDVNNNVEIFSRWRCAVCFYVAENCNTPPANCPLCGVDATNFQGLTQIETAAKDRACGSNKIKILIIGAGIAGVSAAEAARETSENAEITIISNELQIPYYRLNLTRYLAGEINRDALPIHPKTWYEDNNISLILGVKVENLNVELQQVHLSNSETLFYDRLIISAGSHPNIPSITGIDLNGVFSLRTTEDAEKILHLAKKNVKCVCIGGGVLGIEIAAALARRKADVTLLESHAWLMPRQLNVNASNYLERHICSLGVKILKNARTKTLNGKESNLTKIDLNDDRSVEADLAVLAIGVRPNTALARKTGISVNNGIIVNNRMSTSITNIYAAGDAAEHNGQLYGNWAASQIQGQVAGKNAAGGNAIFTPMPRNNVLKAVGLNIASIGTIHATDGNDMVLEEKCEDKYATFVFRDNRMIGALFVGDTDLAAIAHHAISARIDFTKSLAEFSCNAIVNFLRKGAR